MACTGDSFPSASVNAGNAPDEMEKRVEFALLQIRQVGTQIFEEGKESFSCPVALDLQPIPPSSKGGAVDIVRGYWNINGLVPCGTVGSPFLLALESQCLDKGTCLLIRAIGPMDGGNGSCAQPISESLKLTAVGASRICRDRGRPGSCFAIRSPFFPVLQPQGLDKGTRLLKGEIGTIPI